MSGLYYVLDILHILSPIWNYLWNSYSLYYRKSRYQMSHYIINWLKLLVRSLPACQSSQHHWLALISDRCLCHIAFSLWNCKSANSICFTSNFSHCFVVINTNVVRGKKYMSKEWFPYIGNPYIGNIYIIQILENFPNQRMLNLKDSKFIILVLLKLWPFNRHIM